MCVRLISMRERTSLPRPNQTTRVPIGQLWMPGGLLKRETKDNTNFFFFFARLTGDEDEPPDSSSLAETTLRRLDDARIVFLRVEVESLECEPEDRGENSTSESLKSSGSVSAKQ